MSYTVLARRYRSRDFDELVGQEPISRTLANSIKAGRAAHAYLFCGTRGVGKTSMARIFAKALNVTDDLEQAQEISEAIMRGDDLDVIEIDGASNRGINEAKDLIAGAGLSPSRCPYKIYIIDEVHMLTTPAFNALLKTMEEPPAHVKFILCTTEATKVPATIQSRCQRFDFRPLSMSELCNQLAMIIESEGATADEQVIAQIARLGQGSMRDALSLLDRLLAAGDKTLTSDLLEQMLGLPDQTLVSNLVSAITNSDAGATLTSGAELLSGGSSIEQALESLIEHLRELMLITSCGKDTDLVSLSGPARDNAIKQTENLDTAGLVHMIALCDAAARNVKHSSTARAIFDATLVRLAMSEHLADIASLLVGNTPVRKKKGPVVITQPKAHETKIANVPAAIVEPKPTATHKKSEPLSGNELWGQVCEIAAKSTMHAAKVDNLAFKSFDGQIMQLAITTTDTGLAKILS